MSRLSSPRPWLGIRPGLLLLLLATLSACASRPARDEVVAVYEAHAGESVNEIRLVNLRSWQPVSRDSVVIWVQGNQAYLVTVGGVCLGLEYGLTLGIDRTVGHRLVTRFDSLIVDGQRCPIRMIRPLDYRAVQRDLSALQAGGT